MTGIEAVVAFDGASVSGQVEHGGAGDDKAAVRATVHLIPRAGRNRYLRAQKARTTPEGGFSFSTPPGSYRLLALPLMSGVQIFDPAAQAALRPFVRQVDLDAGENASVNLRLPPLGDR